MNHAPERHDIPLLDIREAALVNRQRHMRIGCYCTMTRKVFAGSRHACIMHARLVGIGQLSDNLRTFVQGTIADY